MCVWLFDLSGRSVRIGDRCNGVSFDRFGLGPLFVSRMCVLGTLVSVSHVVCGRTFILAVFPSSGCLPAGVFGPGAWFGALFGHGGCWDRGVVGPVVCWVRMVRAMFAVGRVAPTRVLRTGFLCVRIFVGWPVCFGAGVFRVSPGLRQRLLARHRA